MIQCRAKRRGRVNHMSDFMQANSGFLGMTWHDVIVAGVVAVICIAVIAFLIILRRSSKELKFTVYDMAVVGVMAAICFVVTYFIKIPVPTPAGQVMIKLANAFCLLAGVLFGGVRGGLAAGIGSMFYDLLDPVYITDAPLTLIRFFLMAFICGVICWKGDGKGKSMSRIVIGTVSGSVFSLLFYFIQSIVKQLLLGQPFDVAVVQCFLKMGVSSINAVVAVVVACLLAPVCRKGLEQAGLYRKMKTAK